MKRCSEEGDNRPERYASAVENTSETQFFLSTVVAQLVWHGYIFVVGGYGIEGRVIGFLKAA